MKQKGKAVETKTTLPPDYDYSSSDQNPCHKHPPSSVGICAYCLKERLIELVCSDCGEQRLSSCSCSDFSSSNRNSSATDIGSVGRISFLIENERKDSHTKSEEGFLLKRSGSTCVGGKRKGGIWRIARLFRRKRDKGDRNEMWVFDYVGVSRSRSLCSLRGASFHEESSTDFGFSSAKVSDFTVNSGMDSERPSGFSEAEPRKSGLFRESDFGLSGNAKRSVFPVKESDCCELDESGFIDLRLDLVSESRKAEYSVLDSVSQGSEFPVSVEKNHEVLRKGGSCRVTGSETGRKRDRRGYKGWRWIFKHHPHWRSGGNKKDEGRVLGS